MRGYSIGPKYKCKGSPGADDKAASLVGWWHLMSSADNSKPHM